jgi:hypothetical protein
MFAARHIRVGAWMALAAMLLGVVSSTHSGWQTQPRHGLLADICSASGAAPVSGQDGPAAPTDARHDDHCWFCSKTGAATVLLEGGPGVHFHVPASEPPLLRAPVVAAGFPPLLTPPQRAPPRLA